MLINKVPVLCSDSTWHRVALLAISLLLFSSSSLAQGRQQQSALGLDALNSTSNVHEVAHTRRVFWLGGQYTGPDNAARITGQVYTEELLPVGGPKRPNPLVFIHHGFLTGAQWLQTPDNRRGFASYFLQHGYAVYLIDVASLGRSFRLPDETVNLPNVVSTFQDVFTAPEKAKTLFWPQAALHNQFPGTGERGDPIFEQVYASLVTVPNRYNDTESAVTSAMCDLLARIGSSFLVTHAYGTFFPFLIADRCPDSVQGIFSMDADPSPFRDINGNPAKPYGLSDIPLTYNPPVNDPATDLPQVKVGTDSASFQSCQLQRSPAKQLKNLVKTPIMQVISEAGPHILTGHCQPTFLRQAGVPVSLIYLADVGIKGNGQLMHIEKNNLDIAGLADRWFRSRDGKAGKANLTDVSSANGTAQALAKALGTNISDTGGSNGTTSGSVDPS